MIDAGGAVHALDVEHRRLQRHFIAGFLHCADQIDDLDSRLIQAQAGLPGGQIDPGVPYPIHALERFLHMGDAGSAVHAFYGEGEFGCGSGFAVFLIG